MRRERPRSGCAAEQRYKLAPFWIELHAIPHDERGAAPKDIELAAISQRLVEPRRQRKSSARPVGAASASSLVSARVTVPPAAAAQGAPAPPSVLPAQQAFP